MHHKRHYDAEMNVVRDGQIAARQYGGSADVALHGDVAESLDRAAELVEASLAQATIEAYRLDMADWTAWAEPRGVTMWPIEVAALAAYIGHLEKAGKSVSTISRRCVAISRLCRDHGLVSPAADPMIGRLMQGLRREHAGEKTPKRAFTADLVRNFIENEKTSARDRALAAVAFVTGLRRAELVALKWSDVTECPDTAGLVLYVRRSKSDQTGEGAHVAVPRTFADVDPAKLLLDWRESSKNTDLVFPISVATVLRVAKRIAMLAGLDPAEYGAHSFRSGLCTTAARAGVSLAESMQASRHKSADVAASYVRTVAASENQAHRAAADALAGK